MIVTALCLLLAFPLAYKLARTQSRFKNLLVMLLVLPLFVGNAVRAAGWMTLFGNRGFLNVTLQWLGITSRADRDSCTPSSPSSSASWRSISPTSC